MTPGRRVTFASVLATTVALVGFLVWRGMGPAGQHAPQAAPPDVLLLTLDATRADHLGCYGARYQATANLDGLCREGAVFERAYTQSPLCLPGHATLLTGTGPIRHGLRDDGRGYLAEGVPTLAETFREAGYRTAAFVSSTALDRRFGLDRGFDEYADDLGPAGKRPDSSERSVASETVARALSWLTAAQGRPVFLWVHLDDARPPNTAAPEFERRFPESPYVAELAGMDTQIGLLLAGFREARPRWLIAAAADHGTGLGEHGEDGHGRFLYSATTRIPILLAYPGAVPAARRVAPIVRAMDVAPTLADLAGLPAPLGTEGQSLVGLLSGGSAEGPARASIETMAPWGRYGFRPLLAVRSGPYLYIRGSSRELYDSDQDRRETDELSGRLPRIAADLERQVEAQPHGVDAGSEPRREQDLYRRFREGSAAEGRGDSAAARAEYTSILADWPGFVMARLRLSELLLREGRLTESKRELEALVERGEATDAAFMNLALVHHRLHRRDDSLRWLRRGASAFPRSAAIHHRLGRVLLERGQAQEAATALAESVRLEPRFLDAQLALGDALLAAGRPTEAAAAYRRVREMAPQSQEAGEAARKTARDPANRAAKLR